MTTTSNWQPRLSAILLFCAGVGACSGGQPTPADRDGAGGTPSGTVGWAVGTPLPEGSAGSGGSAAYGVILHTTDAGKTWTRQGDADSVPNETLAGLGVLSVSEAWMTGTSRALSTTDGGTIWVAHPYPAGTPDMASMWSVDSSVHWVVGYGGTVLLTTDGGAQWTTSQVTLPTAQLQGVFALSAEVAWVGGGLGYAENAEHVWRTIDGGKTWTLQYSVGYKAIEAIAGAPGSCAAADSCTLYVGGGGNVIAKSVNGGQSWTLQTTVDRDFDDINGLAVVDANHAFAVYDYGLKLTTDGGTTWGTASQPPVGEYPMAIWAGDAENVWLGGPGSLAHSLDGGQKWEPSPTLPVTPDGFYGIGFASH